MSEEIIPDWVMNEIGEWIVQRKYGFIQLNTQAGKVININKHETIKPDAPQGIKLE